MKELKEYILEGLEFKTFKELTRKRDYLYVLNYYYDDVTPKLFQLLKRDGDMMQLLSLDGSMTKVELPLADEKFSDFAAIGQGKNGYVGLNSISQIENAIRNDPSAFYSVFTPEIKIYRELAKK